MTTQIGRREAAADHPQPVVQLAGFDRLGNDRAVCRDGHHHLARLVRHDRGGRHQQRRRGLAGGNAQPRELSGSDRQIRIGDRRARMDRSAAAVERVVDESPACHAGRNGHRHTD